MKNPSDVIFIDVFYVGYSKRVNCIYQCTDVDAYSSFTQTNLYTDKSALSTSDFTMYLYRKSIDTNVKSIFTDNGKKFMTNHKSTKKQFKELLNELYNKYLFIKVGHP